MLPYNIRPRSSSATSSAESSTRRQHQTSVGNVSAMGAAPPDTYQHSSGKLSRTVKQLKRAMTAGTYAKHSFSPQPLPPQPAPPSTFQDDRQSLPLSLDATSIFTHPAVPQRRASLTSRLMDTLPWASGRRRSSACEPGQRSDGHLASSDGHLPAVGLGSFPVSVRTQSTPTKLDTTGRSGVALLRVSYLKNGITNSLSEENLHTPSGYLAVDSVDSPAEIAARRRYVASLQTSRCVSDKDLSRVGPSQSRGHHSVVSSQHSSTNSVFEAACNERDRVPFTSRGETNTVSPVAVQPSQSLRSSRPRFRFKKDSSSSASTLLRSLSSLTRLGRMRQSRAVMLNHSPSRAVTEPGAIRPAVHHSTSDLSRSNKMLSVEQHSFVLVDVGCSHLGLAVHEEGATSDTEFMRKDTSTAVLLNPHGEFHSLGDTAARYYYHLSITEKKKWLFVESFMRQVFAKMTMSADMTVFAKNDAELMVCDLLVHVITYCIQKATTICGDESRDVRRFRWVIALPDGWSHDVLCDTWRLATQKCELMHVEFMSTVQAIWQHVRDIDSYNKLVHALPRQSAHSATSHMNNKEPKPITSDASKSPALPSPKVLIVKMGGEITFLSVKEIAAHSKTAITSSVPSCGSAAINTGFFQLFEQIFGHVVMSDFKEKFPAGYYDLQQEIEFQKRTLVSCHSERRSYLSLFLPFSFLIFVQKALGRPVEKVIRDQNDISLLWSPEGVMQVSLKRVRYLLEAPLARIQYEIQEILKRFHNIQKIFLVGGFAESPVVRDDIQCSLGQKHEVIIPEEPTLSILKGMKTHVEHSSMPLESISSSVSPVPQCISSTDGPVLRSSTTFVATHTYGLAILCPFRTGVHPEGKRVVRHGRAWCIDLFDCLLSANETYPSGHLVERLFCPASSQQSQLKVNIYRCSYSIPNSTPHSTNGEKSDLEQLHFITDPGVHLVGQLVIQLCSRTSSTLSSTSHSTKQSTAVSRQSSFATTIGRSGNSSFSRPAQSHSPQQIKTLFIFHTERHITFKAVDSRQNVALSSRFIRPDLRDAQQTSEMV